MSTRGRRDIIDIYTTLPWHMVSKEVARLKIDLASVRGLPTYSRNENWEESISMSRHG